LPIPAGDRRRRQGATATNTLRHWEEEQRSRRRRDPPEWVTDFRDALARSGSGEGSGDEGLLPAAIAHLELDRGQYAHAEALYRQALPVMEAGGGAADTDRLRAVRGLAELLRATGREAEAGALAAEADSPGGNLPGPSESAGQVRKGSIDHGLGPW